MRGLVKEFQQRSLEISLDELVHIKNPKMLDNGLIPCTGRFRKYVHEMLGN